MELHELRSEERVPDAQEALDQAHDALAEAWAIVELEGPQNMVALAQVLYKEVVGRAEELCEMAPLHRATHALTELLDQELTIVPTLDGEGCHHPANDAQDALLALGQLWDEIPPDQWERSLTDQQWEAIDTAQKAAQDALNACPGLSPEHSRTLINIYSRSRQDWRTAEAHTEAAERRLDTARECFLTAAREELSGGQ
ncbi:hypothetical protein ACFY3J_34150 [Streptomyces sp. NPDC001231]|uniref:hypothetical protein n=1 Tax=Streptomyces sp. NPDC001231 TaxID=3364549 RepID=UPI0036C772EA